MSRCKWRETRFDARFGLVWCKVLGTCCPDTDRDCPRFGTRFGSVWLGLCNLVVQWARKPPTVWLPSGLGGMRESPTIGSAGRITGQTVPGSTVQRQHLQQCAKISSENRALVFEMPPSFKILKCNWMWPGRAGLVHPSFLIVL